MRRICVFCGASSGTDPAYAAAATAFGELLARSGLGLVFGGSGLGLMGAVSNAAMDAGADVIGVIPQALVEREVAHPSLADLRVVASMHERKALMVELSDGFVALPGGLGTLDELFEVLTWAQLGIHTKPCGLVNVNGFFDPLLAYLDQAATSGLLKPEHRAMIYEAPHGEQLLEAFRGHVPPRGGKWIDVPVA